MHRRNREISIFSLSALDLFCGAMGAFMLLALIALPHYKKNLKEKLNHTFLVVVISWESMADIDLHVRTPAGNHYYYKRHNRPDKPPRPYPNEAAELSMDIEIGSGGAEVWQMLNAGPGKYQIGLHNYHSGTPPTTVKGLVLYRDGSHKFAATLPHLPEDKTVVDVIVDEQGNVSCQNL